MGQGDQAVVRRDNGGVMETKRTKSDEEIMEEWRDTIATGESEPNMLELLEGEKIEVHLKKGGFMMKGPGFFFGDFLPLEAFKD